MASRTPHHEAETNITEVQQDYTHISPRKLNITWGKDDRYWQLPEAASSSACELKQVCWLEVTGAAVVQAGKKYEVGFRVSLKSDAFGWGGAPLYLMAKLGKGGRYKSKSTYLQDEPREKDFDIPKGGFTVEVPSAPVEDPTLYFGLYEVWSGKWKGGIKIHYAFVREVAQ